MATHLWNKICKTEGRADFLASFHSGYSTTRSLKCTVPVVICSGVSETRYWMTCFRTCVNNPTNSQVTLSNEHNLFASNNKITYKRVCVNTSVLHFLHVLNSILWEDDCSLVQKLFLVEALVKKYFPS